MQATQAIHDSLLAIFPTVSSELLDLLAAAWENTNLTFTEFCTINDLLECADCKQSAALHVLLLILFLALEEGSLCVEATEDDLARRLRDLVEPISAVSLAQQIISDCRPETFPKLIGVHRDEGRPVVMREVGTRRFFYFQLYLCHELAFESALRTRLQAALQPLTAGPSPPGGEGRMTTIRAALDTVLVRQPLSPGGQPLHFGTQQRLAIALALLRNFVIISGGPGAGKTSIVVGLLRALVHCGIAPDRIALAAPTGRAAQRLTDAVRLGLTGLPGDCTLAERQLGALEAHTLHHLLRYNPTRGTFLCHAENPLPADVVIVDEVSMVGIALMAQLLQATAPQTRLILLGDKDQLPSVEAGAVLANLLPGKVYDFGPELRRELDEVLAGEPHRIPKPALRSSGDRMVDALRDHVVLLNENYRSQPHIRSAAQAINEQRTTIIEELPVLPADNLQVSDIAAAEHQGGCWWLPQHETNVRHFQDNLRVWAERQYLAAPTYMELIAEAGQTTQPKDETLRQLFHLLGRSRLLTVVREGPYGCVDINDFLDECLRPHLDRGNRGPHFAGAPILITRNDHARRLFNGDIGITLKNPKSGYLAVFARQDGFQMVPADTLPSHEQGFALTVHKSQGSEYDEVLLTLPPTGGRRLMTKEIVYTGITRARRLAIIFATAEAFTAAIGRRIVRTSGIGLEHLRQREVP